MSTKTGVAPQYRTALAVAIKEWLTVITSSSPCAPTANKARCKAAVQVETAQACGAPTYSANSCSKPTTCGPCAIHPERIDLETATDSSTPRSGLVIGILGRVESDSGSSWGRPTPR